MVVRFRKKTLENLFLGVKDAKKPKYDSNVILQFKKTVLKLKLAEGISQLVKIKSLNFEHLKGNLAGYCSVRVNKGYRIIFVIESDDKINLEEMIIIEDLNNHYQ